MQESGQLIYAFGPFRVDPAERLLLRDGEVVSLRPKAFDALLILCQNSQHLVSKDELIEKLWPGTFVEENNLSQSMSLVRRALGTRPDGSTYVETVPGRGYRFVAAVSIRSDRVADARPADPPAVRPGAPAAAAAVERAAGVSNGAATVGSPPPDGVNPAVEQGGWDFGPGPPKTCFCQPRPAGGTPETRYAKSVDLNIAYQVVGDGPIDLVYVPGWVTHLEYAWEEPSLARYYQRLASFSRLILFDKRGTGLSDRTADIPTLEERMDDVRAVMDAAGSERAALFGECEGGNMCALFAATYPQRTLALITYGTFAKRIWDPEYPWAPTLEAREKWLHELEHGWGGIVDLCTLAPSVAQDPRFAHWWSSYLRRSASPRAALTLARANSEIDVRSILPAIRVPTLVLHRTGDLTVKVDEARYIATCIPGAKYVELAGADHLPWVGDQDAALAEVEEFVTGVRHVPEPDRLLATVLVANIVGASKERARDESRWRRILMRYQAHARREIEWFRGRAIESGEEQMLATFDGPARAIRCGRAMSELAGRAGIGICIGLHTGECDVLGENLAGAALEIASQMAARAGPGEVLVSTIVKDLVAGSGIRFGHRRTRVLDENLGGRLFTVEG